MLIFTQDQELSNARRECRLWTGMIAESWYQPENPLADVIPADLFIQQTRAVYFTCQNAGVTDFLPVSELALIVLRATSLFYDQEQIQDMASYFLHHARGNNTEYAGNWIDLILDSEE